MDSLKSLLPFTVVVSILASASLVQSFVPISEFIPYTESDGNSRFRFGDDNAERVSFTYSNFKFLNTSYGSMFISGNGLIAFRQAHTGSSPGTGAECNNPGDIPLIIPFWSDANENVDARSRLTYKEITNAAHLSKINGQVRAAFSQHRRINLTWMLVVTWYNVGSHKANSDSSYRSKRNTFQLIIATNGISSFVIFYYNQIEWWNGGYALAGFDYGGSRLRYKLPGSCTGAIQDLPHASNVNSPGKWIFQVDKEIVVPSPSSLRSVTAVVCGQVKPVLHVQPPVVSIMGNMPLFVHGLCLENNANVSCVYQDKGQPRPTEIYAALLPNNVVVCQVPFLYSLGKMTVNVLVNYPNQSPVIHTQNIYVVKEHEFSDVPKIQVSKADNMLLLSAQWDPELLGMTAIRSADQSEYGSTEVNDKGCQILSETVQIVILEYDGKKWKNLGAIIPPILNNGVHMSQLNTFLLHSLFPRKGKIFRRTFAIETKYTLKSGQSVNKLFASNSLLGTQDLMDFTLDFKDLTSKTSFFDGLCQNWYDSEPNLIVDTLPCPNILEQARLDWRFTLDKAHQNTRILNTAATAVYTQSVPSSSGTAAQCAYDSDGHLLATQASCGRTFRKSPNSGTGYWRHFLDDTLPYMYCCKWGNQTTGDKCNQYFSKRPTNLGTDYVSPRPLRAVGSLHFTTLDGLAYTFNDAGEYWMMRYKEEENSPVISEFKMQVRMEPYLLSSNVSVITAAVMEEIKTEHEVKVQVELNRFEQSLSVFVDGELLKVFDDSTSSSDNEDGALPANDSPWNFQNEFTFYHAAVNIVLKSNDTALISFASGFSFSFNAVDGSLNMNIVGSAGTNMKNKTEGLLGNYDGQENNDFKLPNGTTLEANMTMEAIHKTFGRQWIVKQDETIFFYPSGESYASFYRPSFSPVLLTPEQVKDLGFGDDEDFCENLKDCIFDYLNSGTSGTNKELAMGTHGSTALYQEIDAISKRVVGQCSKPIPPVNGFFNGTSYLVGSSLQLKCAHVSNELNGSENNHTFIICAYPNGDESKTPTWVDWTGIVNPGMSCGSPKNDVVIETKVEKRNEENEQQQQQPDSSAQASSSPSSFLSIWISIIGFSIFAVIFVVFIAAYPPCKPVKHYFTDKYYAYRDSRLRADSISMN